MLCDVYAMHKCVCAPISIGMQNSFDFNITTFICIRYCIQHKIDLGLFGCRYYYHPFPLHIEFEDATATSRWMTLHAHTHGCRRMQGCTVLGCWVLVLCCSWYANVVSVERDRRRVIEEWGESVVNERHILHLLYYYIEEYNGNRTVFGDAAKKCRTNSFMLARMMMHEQYIEAAVGSNEFAFRLNAKALTGAAKGDAIFFFHTIADFFLIQE